MVFERALREQRELVDIALLAERFAGEIDWKRLPEYFLRFDKVGTFDELERQFHLPERG